MSQNSKKIFKIGLVGQNGSGKSSVCQILKENTFNVISLSDIVRIEATNLKRDHSRDSLTLTGNELKAKEGLAVLAIRSIALSEELKSDATVFDSIRNKDEVEYLKSKGVYIIGVTASLEARYERIKIRKRASDLVDFETFKQQCEREYEGQSSGQNIKQAIQECDTIIDNEGSLSDLEDSVKKIIQELKNA